MGEKKVIFPPLLRCDTVLVQGAHNNLIHLKSITWHYSQAVNSSNPTVSLCLAVRTFQIYSLSNFQAHSSLVSYSHCIPPPEFSSYNWVWALWPSSAPPSASGTTVTLSASMSLACLDFKYKQAHIVFVFILFKCSWFTMLGQFLLYSKGIWYSFSYSFPLWLITGYWIWFPVIYSRSLLFIHSLYNSLLSCSIYLSPTYST